jgi:hypothetical protein
MKNKCKHVWSIMLIAFTVMVLSIYSLFMNNVVKENYKLEKLCLVWGYVKYHHSAFLLGQKDWDEELLNLIPMM